MACGPGNEKEKRKINSKLISEFKKFRKMNKDILVVEIIGKISPK
jgi:predicted  nucleic acid-binding Zn-ribbon protein